jgi:MoaA/NifB/PqqE/SkfB family radical SAM enzyme
VPNPEIVSPEFKASFDVLKHTAAVGSQAQRLNGWAANLVTPYPLMPDGKPKLTAAWLEITSFCNQKCTFCPDPFREGKREAMDVETAKRCIDELKSDFHLDYLMLNAFGEPLLHPKIEEILTYLRDGHAPSHFFFTTHGMTLNERNIAMIDRAHPNGILVSLQNDSEESYAMTRDLRIGNYAKLTGNIMNLITRLVQNRRACHVRLYQLVRNGREGFGVPEKILRAFPADWTRFAQAVRRWEDALRPLADDSTVHAVRNTDDQIREAFGAGGWPKLDVLRWRDEKGGEQSVFISPRAPETYANQLPHLAPDWSVKRNLYTKASCRFTRDPGLAIMSNGNLGICCLSLEQNASFGNLRDFGSLKKAVTSEACQRMFAELANGVTRSQDCQICLGSIEKNGSACSGHCG